MITPFTNSATDTVRRYAVGAAIQHSLLSTLDDQNHDTSSKLLSCHLAW